MDVAGKIKELAESALQEPGHFIVDVLYNARQRPARLMIIVDGDNGVTIDQCADLSRKLSALLDEQNVPGAARIYYNRGKALLARKEWALGIQDFQRVIHIHPEIHQAYSNMGIAYYNLKSIDQALEAFNKSLEITQNNPVGYFGKAMTLKKLGETEASEEAFKKACDLGHQTSCIIVSYINKQAH